MLCSNGYPDKYNKNVKIENLNKIKLNKNSLIFHAGTKLIDNDVFATGGRVLNIVSISSVKDIFGNINNFMKQLMKRNNCELKKIKAESQLIKEKCTTQSCDNAEMLCLD